MTRTEILNRLGGHRTAADMDRGLSILADNGLAHPVAEVTAGRTAERWIATDAKQAKDVAAA